MPISFTPSFDMRFLKVLVLINLDFFLFLSTSSSWSKYICSICWTVWKYTTLSQFFHVLNFFRIKYDESVIIALKKFSKGGGDDFRRCVEICCFCDWWNRQTGYYTFLFQFSIWISMKLIFKILIWTVQIKRFEAQVLD